MIVFAIRINDLNDSAESIDIQGTMSFSFINESISPEYCFKRLRETDGGDP